MRSLFIVVMCLVLNACAFVNVPIKNATMLPSKNGKERYTVSGRVLAPNSEPDVTKPYIEETMSQICPNGLKYEGLNEIVIKQLVFGTWMEWSGVVQCL